MSAVRKIPLQKAGKTFQPALTEPDRVVDIFGHIKGVNISHHFVKTNFSYTTNYLAEDKTIHQADVTSLSISDKIKSAIKLIEQSGKQKIGFLGICAVEDDQAQIDASMLEAIDSLIDDHYDIGIYDPAILNHPPNEDQYGDVIKNRPDLRDVIRALPSLICVQGETVMEYCDVIIITKNTPQIRPLIARYLGRKQIIDLVHLFKHMPDFKSYQTL